MAIGNNKSIKSAKLSIQSTKLTKAQKGTIGEYQAIVDLTKKGYHVALACNPQCPFDLVAVGEDAIVKVTFNSGNRKGKQNKTITLITNAIPSTKVLTIKGTVLVSENN